MVAEKSSFLATGSLPANGPRAKNNRRVIALYGGPRRLALGAWRLACLKERMARTARRRILVDFFA